MENQHLMHRSGVALRDVNGDGWVDIYISRIRESNILYINKGNWTFEDQTVSAGVACENCYSTGSTFADVDGDRDLDLIVTALGGPNSVFINDGNGTHIKIKWPDGSESTEPLKGNNLTVTYSGS